MSDSDDSSSLYASYSQVNQGVSKQNEGISPHQNGHANRRITSYYSENSIESLKEESDTEESMSVGDESANLPSVKELASKFDSEKNLKNRIQGVRKSHEVRNYLTEIIFFVYY